RPARTWREARRTAAARATRRNRNSRRAGHDRPNSRPRARPPAPRGAGRLRARTPPNRRPASRLGQERMGADAERSARRVVHVARGLPHGHPARDGPHRPDPQPDRAAARARGPPPAGAPGWDPMTAAETTAPEP